MQKNLDGLVRFLSRMVKSLVLIAIALAINLTMLRATHAEGTLIGPPISGKPLDFKCEILSRENKSEISDSSAYAIDLMWNCNGRPLKLIDQYGVNGGSPEIVTLFFRKKRRLVVLVRWTIDSHAADFQGDIYEVHVYAYDKDNTFVDQKTINARFGNGLDGAINGRNVYFKFKNAALIRKKLDLID